MKYEVRFTTQFKKDLKLAKKQGKDTEKLFAVIEKLANGEPLEEEALCSLSEEEKSCDAVSEEGTSFVNAQVVKLAKQYVNDIKKGAVYQEESFEEKFGAE